MTREPPKPDYIGSYFVWRLMNGTYYQSRLFPFRPTHASPPGGITAYIINVYSKPGASK